MSTNPTPNNDWGALLIYQPIPKQQTQAVCKQTLGHLGPRRTFYWLALDAGGPICQECVNVRNTRLALAGHQADGNSSKNDNPEPESKKSKRGRSTKAPAYIGAVLAKRASGQSINSIARDTKSSHNTVRKVLQETRYDQEILEGRKACVELIPKAVKAVDQRLEKGDGELGRRLLGDMQVIGGDTFKKKGPEVVHQMSAIFQNCQLLIKGDSPTPAPAEVIDVTPDANSEPQSSA